ncbi:MAG: FIST C-terminal domain-containing protein, partial [Betaproteobacteria bacterium]|nr:FIST C-terminal domain-containing protein [Betaproteobacteria bacterium]
MNSIRLASSHASSAAAAASELAGQFSGFRPSLIVYFAADAYSPDELAQSLRAKFPAPTVVAGCTTAGEIGPEGYADGSVVALGFSATDFSAAATLITGLKSFDLGECQRRVENTLQRITLQKKALGFSNTLGLLLIDGLSLREEPLGRAVQLVLGEIPLVGGSAGDSLKFQKTSVFLDGESLSDAAVLVLISTDLPFRIVKTQHFERTEGRMVVTAARPAERVVSEINGYPAALEYARIVGLPVENLNPLAFAAYPVVVRIGGSEYVRSIQKVNPDHSLSFYCAIDEGIVLSRAHGLDALANLEEMLAAVASEIGEPQAVLACDCILR